MKPFFRTSIIVVCTVVLSTIVIQADDLLKGVGGNLLGLAIESESGCGEGAVLLQLGSGALCVDRFEAAPSENCAHDNPQNGVETQQNLNNQDCHAVSRSAELPWRFVSLAQAQQLCARADKRLPSTSEWYDIALSMGSSTSCVTNQNGVAPTGGAECQTKAGVHDLVGNVWEWNDAEVVDGTYNDRQLPESGFVDSVDSAGVVVSTRQSPVSMYGADYAKTSPQGVFGIIRGGFYDSKEDAGLFAQNLAVPLNLQTDGVGFRCVATY